MRARAVLLMFRVGLHKLLELLDCHLLGSDEEPAGNGLAVKRLIIR